MSDKAPFCCLFGFLLICVGVLNGFLLVFGVQDEDSSCVEGTRGGLDLPTWCKLVSSITFSVLLAYVLFILCDPERLRFAIIVLFGLHVIFYVITWVWGVFILATNENNNCVARGEDMAVAAIVYLALGWMVFVMPLFTLCSE